eukprot:3366718-Amphidinium_carterae.2
MEQRGDEKVIQQMQGLPWKLRPGFTLPGEEPEVYRGVRIDSKPTQVTELPPVLPAASNLGGQTGPRRVYLRREVEMRPVAEGGYGLTENCRGCKAIQEGRTAIAHEEHCRRRVEAEMLRVGLDTHRVEAARKRKADATAERDEGIASAPVEDRDVAGTATASSSEVPGKRKADVSLMRCRGERWDRKRRESKAWRKLQYPWK